MADTFVLDTCVLLADPQSPLRFDEHDVVLPLVVIEELDRKKTRMDEVGANARAAIRLIEELGASRLGGMRRAGGPARGRNPAHRAQRDHLGAPAGSSRSPDARSPNPGHLSQPGGAAPRRCWSPRTPRCGSRGRNSGVAVQDYRADTVPVEQLQSGLIEHFTEGEVIDRLFDEGKIELQGVEAEVNQFIVLKAGTSHSALARVIESDPVVTVERVPTHVRAFGVEPKNVRQTVALHQLLDPDIPAVSVMGMAGTGKTFLALAAALEQVVEQGRYRRVSVYRPLVAVGRQEVGYLPGDLNEKLAPWMAAVHDNLYALFSDAGVDGARHAIDELVDRGELEMAAVTYLRGRSITGEFVIIDEAQNLELPTLKVILTRMSRDSKVVFCGDLSQVDNPYISPFGGMAALIEKFKGSPLFGHITLERSVRSPLAEMAANIL